MVSYVKTLLKKTSLIKTKKNLNIANAYENSDHLYQIIWQNILKDYANKDMDYFETYKFKVRLNIQNHISKSESVEYSMCSPDTEDEIGGIYTRPLDINFLKYNRIFCIDSFVNLLIKDGFDVKEMTGEYLEFEISRKQIKFLTDNVEYTNNDEFHYSRIGKQNEE